MKSALRQSVDLIFVLSLIVFVFGKCNSTDTCVNIPTSVNADSLYQFYKAHKPYRNCNLAATDIDKNQTIQILSGIHSDSIVIVMALLEDSSLSLVFLSDTINCTLAGICCPGNCPPKPKITFAHYRNHALEFSELDSAYEVFTGLSQSSSNELLGIKARKYDIIHAVSNGTDSSKIFAFVKINGVLSGLFLSPFDRCDCSGICCPGNCPTGISTEILKIFEPIAYF